VVVGLIGLYSLTSTRLGWRDKDILVSSLLPWLLDCENCLYFYSADFGLVIRIRNSSTMHPSVYTSSDMFVLISIHEFLDLNMDVSVMIGTYMLNKVGRYVVDPRQYTSATIKMRPLILVHHKVDRNEIPFFTRLSIPLPLPTCIFHFWGLINT